jgi:hypothetical protein
MLGGEPRTDDRNGQPAEPGHDLELGRLRR